MLGGVIKKANQSRRGTDEVVSKFNKHKLQIEKWENFCAEIGEEPADVAHAWLIHQPAVTAPIIGPRTLEQLEKSMRVIDVNLNVNQLDKLDEIFPPAGQAPQYYAW